MILERYQTPSLCIHRLSEAHTSNLQGPRRAKHISEVKVKFFFVHIALSSFKRWHSAHNETTENKTF